GRGGEGSPVGAAASRTFLMAHKVLGDWKMRSYKLRLRGAGIICKIPFISPDGRIPRANFHLTA
ncbi:MAG: hypothetical protein WHS90_19395, partial [Caldilinea sp.]|uniref:hypothetical protein n=1 Tax=Caldilinea sp. TaxID=2293560 RepID=UPI0030AED60D